MEFASLCPLALERGLILGEGLLSVCGLVVPLQVGSDGSPPFFFGEFIRFRWAMFPFFQVGPAVTGVHLILLIDTGAVISALGSPGSLGVQCGLPSVVDG